MRLTAYKAAIDEVITDVPNAVIGLKEHFKDNFSPRRSAIEFILNRARKDEKLFHSEFAELVLYWKGGASPTDGQ